MYSNEKTILFNIVQKNILMGPVNSPHFVRIPEEQITGTYEEFLKSYEPFRNMVQDACRDYSVWYYSEVYLYCIQDDTYFSIPVQEIIDEPEVNATLKLCDILEKILKDYFNETNTWKSQPIDNQIDNILTSIKKFNISLSAIRMLIEKKTKGLAPAVIENINNLLTNYGNSEDTVDTGIQV